MKIFLWLLLISQIIFAMDSKIIPMLSSNPNSGTSVGLINTNIYQTDEESSPSQAMLIAQYSATDSWSIFAINSSYFDDNSYKLLLVGGYLHNNSKLYIEGGDSLVAQDIKIDANFETDLVFVLAQLLYEVFDDIYLGGQMTYLNSKINALDYTGAIFLESKGMKDSSNSSCSFIAEYDTVDHDEKFYPRSGVLSELALNFYPTQLGNSISYYNIRLDARFYNKGFKESDVWANQFYGSYTSKNTPDSALPALGFRSVLRGFAVGQYKARNMSAFQSEYRYQLDGTKFKFVAFGGVANLSGGSAGKGSGNRDRDNGNYASAGMGVRYLIQKAAGVDYRVDFAYTSTDDYGLYATINQAF